MVVGGSPASTQAWVCPQASRRTQLPIGRMRPQSSATGINCAGGTGPRVGMRPADQRFRPGDRSGPQIDLRLVVQREFLPFQGAPQALLDGLPLHRADVHGGLEKLIALASIFLCLIHRGVRVLDQRLGIQAVVGIDAHADAGGDMEIVLVDGMGFRHRLQHPSAP